MIDTATFGPDSILLHEGIDPETSPHFHGGPFDQQVDTEGRIILYGNEQLKLSNGDAVIVVSPDEYRAWLEAVGV